jgi:hypothetical protein
MVTKLSKIWVWDPGSGKNPFRIPDPGSKGQKGTGSRIRIRYTDKTKDLGRMVSPVYTLILNMSEIQQTV